MKANFFFIWCLLSFVNLPAIFANQNLKAQNLLEPTTHGKSKNQKQKTPPYMCFCIPADDVFFEKILDLIGSIHHTNFDKLKEIAVFDLGFTKNQLKILKSIEKVSVHAVELRHPDLLKYFQSRPSNMAAGKPVRGWYAWKPVVIKQASNMFSYFLYLDAGCTVVKPLDDIFTYIQDHGYLLVKNSSKYSIGDHCTKNVISLFSLSSSKNVWILNEMPIAASIQGISSMVYDSYVKPIYDLTTDLKFFEDDGSSPLGFGWARHDQTLFSIQASLLGLEQITPDTNYHALIQGKEITLCFSNNLKLKAAQILRRRSSGKFIQFIKYKK